MSEHLPSSAASELIQQCLGELGVDLDAVELRGNGPKRILRIFIDAEGGVPLDLVTQVSRELSGELDRSVVMGNQGYTLEVTSRGVDRPLTLPRHWARNLDRLVRVTLADGEEVRGRIAGATENSAVLDTGTTLPYADVTNAVIEPELNRRPPATPSSAERNG
jgi:ribosome maturation factor RimP